MIAQGVLEWLGLLQAKQLPELPPLHIDSNGWIEGDGVTRLPSHASWFYPRLSTPTGAPIAIVAHASETNLGTGLAMANKRRLPRQPGDRVSSWHFSVEDGSIIQQVSCESGAWHALTPIPGVGAPNRVAIGIEMVGWEHGPFPEGQVLQAMRLWKALVTSYGIPRSRALYPHSAIDRGNEDPGDLFMSTCAPRILDYAFA